MIEERTRSIAQEKSVRSLRLGFAGLGWIGRQRLESIRATGLAEVVAIVEPDEVAAMQATAALVGVKKLDRFDSLLEEELDGIVIATPSAQHAGQAISALQRGIPVFCQKPLGRNLHETSAVISAAKASDCLLGVDLSYRYTAGMQAIRKLIQNDELGAITAIEATFHNAYGPEKSWFYSKKRAGGGCLLDLGIHLVDLALWSLEYPDVRTAYGWTHLGEPRERDDEVEDHAAGMLLLEGGASLLLSCSWGSHAGCDAEIRMQFFGTKGGASFRNIGGSFYDFTAERFHPDRTREILSNSTEEWGGRAAVAWLEQLYRSRRFDPEVENLNRVAEALDGLY